MNRNRILAAVCGGMFGLCLATIGGSQHRSNRIIELQASLLADDNPETRKLLDSYDDRQPLSHFQAVLVFAAGATFLVGVSTFNKRARTQ